LILLPVRLDQPQCRFPLATTGLVVAQVVMFALTWIPGGFDRAQLRYGFMPQYESFLTLFTHMFLHDGYHHLIGNLIFFILPAMKVEDAIGSLRFLAFFFSCGIAALAGHVAMAGTLPVPLVGASGAISGIVGAFMFLYPKSVMSFLLFPLPLVVRLKTWFFLGFWIVKEVLLGYFLKISELDSPVAIWAHVGGFLFGALSMWCFFGWDGGLGGELRLGALRFLSTMKVGLSQHRRLGTWLGIALQAFPAAYALGALADGGFVNTSRPRDLSEHRTALVREIANRQSAEMMFQKALESGSGASAISRMKRDEFRAYMGDQYSGMCGILEGLVQGSVQPPRGMIGDSGRFFREEFPRFPRKCQIGVESVSPVSVLYTPGLKYWIFCGTNQQPRDVFRAYLEELDRRNWAVDRPLFDAERNAGIMNSSDGEWALEIVVAGDGAPATPTRVLWHLEKIPKHEDESS